MRALATSHQPKWSSNGPSHSTASSPSRSPSGHLPSASNRPMGPRKRKCQGAQPDVPSHLLYTLNIIGSISVCCTTLECFHAIAIELRCLWIKYKNGNVERHHTVTCTPTSLPLCSAIFFPLTRSLCPLCRSLEDLSVSRKDIVSFSALNSLIKWRAK